MEFTIGLCMLFVPFATKSLINTGFESGAALLAGAPAAAAAGAIKLYGMKYGKALAKEPFTMFKGTRNFASRNYNRIKTGVQKSRDFAEKSKDFSQKLYGRVRSFGETDARVRQARQRQGIEFHKGKEDEKN